MESKLSLTFRQEKPGQLRQHGKRVQADADVLPAHAAAVPAVAGSPASPDALLRDFDMCTKWGPCLGLTRLERWERAHKFGLDPPAEVKAAILGLGEDSPSNQCVWAGRV